MTEVVCQCNCIAPNIVAGAIQRHVEHSVLATNGRVARVSDPVITSSMVRRKSSMDSEDAGHWGPGRSAPVPPVAFVPPRARAKESSIYNEGGSKEGRGGSTGEEGLH